MTPMAIHQNLAEADAIDEYIELARIGLNFKKPDGGCLGYPSTLLLFCVIDALSNHLGFPSVNRVSRGPKARALCQVLLY
jgi:hypothetical protein